MSSKFLDSFAIECAPEVSKLGVRRVGRLQWTRHSVEKSFRLGTVGCSECSMQLQAVCHTKSRPAFLRRSSRRSRS